MKIKTTKEIITEYKNISGEVGEMNFVHQHWINVEEYKQLLYKIKKEDGLKGVLDFIKHFLEGE